MKSYSIVCSTYEEAVNKARLLYGDAMRILRRRDFTANGLMGLGGRSRCEIEVFVVDSAAEHDDVSSETEESKSDAVDMNDEGASYSLFFEENDKQAEQLKRENALGIGMLRRDDSMKVLDPFLEKAKKLLNLNDFNEDFSERLLADVKKQLVSALPGLPSSQNFEILLLDNIVSSFESDHITQLYPPRFFVLAGSSGVGKTAAASKIGNLFSSGLGKSVEVVSLVNGEVESPGLAAAVDLNGVFHTEHGCDESLESIIGPKPKDIYIIDSFSFSANDDQSRERLLSFYQRLPKDDAKHFLVMDASMKDRDVVRVFSLYENIAFQSLVLTKCDESETIGNVISVCNRYGLPLLFITDGKDLMANIHFASSFAVLSKLKGFDLDMNMLVQNN